MTPAMNIEQARFNMIEQQIRPWDVLDPGVLDLLAVVKREDFVPAGAPRAGLRRHRGAAAAERPDACWRRRSRRACCRTWTCSAHERVLEVGAGSGYMAALLAHRAQHVITLEIDPELARLRQRQPAPRRHHATSTVREADGAARLPADGPFDVIVLSGSVAEVPQRAAGAAEGRAAGWPPSSASEPMMRAMLVTRTGEPGYATVELFDTVAPRLRGFAEPSRFHF